MLHKITVLLIMIVVFLSIAACGGPKVKTEAQAITLVQDYLKSKSSNSLYITDPVYAGMNCFELLSRGKSGNWQGFENSPNKGFWTVYMDWDAPKPTIKGRYNEHKWTIRPDGEVTTMVYNENWKMTNC